MSLVLSGTDGLSDVDGSASTPAIRGTDANTGVFFGSDIVGFATGGTERARFNPTGALVLAGGSTSANGIGITFPATQSASSDANTLDDYEEGTFTPVVQGSTTAGTATYSTQVGCYTKIGNRVLFNLRINYSSGNGTGNLRVGGLPFTSNSSGNLVAISHYIENVTLSANNIPAAYVIPNETYISIDQIPVGGGAATSVPYDGAAAIILSGQYFV